jgi:hypothetical protein
MSDPLWLTVCCVAWGTAHLSLLPRIAQYGWAGVVRTPILILILLFLCPDYWMVEERYAFKRIEFGRWVLKIPPKEDGSCAIKHLCKIKVTLFFLLLVLMHQNLP